MAISPAQILDKVNVILETIGRLPSKERSTIPTIPFAESFNELLQLAKEVAPAADPRLWPKPLSVVEKIHVGNIVNARYVEIEIYARQIKQLVDP